MPSRAVSHVSKTQAAKTQVTKSGVDKRWFVQRIADKQLSQRKIAGILKLPPSAVSLTLASKRDMAMSEAVQWARILGVPLDEVLRRAGVEPPKEGGTTVPIVGWVDESGEIHMEKVQGPKTAPRPVEVPQDAVALRIQDGGPMDGWLAYFVPGDHLEPDAVGRWSVSKVTNGPQYLRVLQRGYESGKWSLQPMRPAVDVKKIENVKVDWACPVFWIKAG